MSRHATPYTRALVRQLHLLGFGDKEIAKATGVTKVSVSNIAKTTFSKESLFKAVASDLGIETDRNRSDDGWRIVELFVGLVEIRAKVIMMERGIPK